MEKLNLKQLGAPVDLNTAAVTGARIKLDKGNRLAFIVSMGGSTGATVEFTLQQHNAASAGTSKALSVANPYYHKVAAASVFTKVEPSSAASVYDLSTLFAADEGIAVLEVLAEDLDVQGGFYWASLNIADSGAAKIGSVLYAVHESYFEPAYSEAL